MLTRKLKCCISKQKSWKTFPKSKPRGRRREGSRAGDEILQHVYVIHAKNVLHRRLKNCSTNSGQEAIGQSRPILPIGQNNGAAGERAAASRLAAVYPAIHIHYADIKLKETSNAFKIQSGTSEVCRECQLLTQFIKLPLPTVSKNTTVPLQKSLYYLEGCGDYVLASSYQEWLWTTYSEIT